MRLYVNVSLMLVIVGLSDVGDPTGSGVLPSPTVVLTDVHLH